MKFAIAAAVLAVTLLPTAPAFADAASNKREADAHHRKQTDAANTQRQNDNRTVQRRR